MGKLCTDEGLRPDGANAVIQVLSRYWALWGIVEVAPEAVKEGALKLFTVGDVTFQLNLITLLFCWSTTEILRYGFYAAKASHSPFLGSAADVHMLSIQSAHVCGL